MAITQYSRIQHRRGNYVDLPTVLNTSEIGHVLDQQRLFIGNGQLADGAPVVGNTEIITDFTLLNNPLALKYIYRSNTPVVAQTGPNANTPVVRSVGQKLDDMVSIKDFGAIGDGVTDDTNAINQALENLYTVAIPGPYGVSAAYRTLYFPAGLYLISDYIYLPPYVRVVGDGPSRTIIKQTNLSKTSVVKTADSLFQNGLQLGMNSAVLPTNIHAEGIMFQHAGDQNIISLERASNVRFVRCGFLGAWTGASSLSSGIYLDKLGAVYTHKNIKFESCAFLHTSYAFYQDIHGQFANEIYFDLCNFSMCGYGVFNQSDIKDVKVTNSIFDTIAKIALIANPLANGVSSANNTFQNCGDVSNPVMLFQNGALQCSSIGDNFYTNAGSNIVDNGANSVILNNTGDFVFQNISISSKQGPITLNSGATNVNTGISFDLTVKNSLFIDYTIIRDNFVRSGRLFIMSNHINNPSATDTTFSDLFSESGLTGITFDYSISGNTLYIVYSSTVGNQATLNVQPKSWMS